MNKKNYILILLGMLAATFATVHSDEAYLQSENYYNFDESNCPTCDYNPCRQQTGLTATVLFLKPNVDDSHFVLDSTSNIFGTSHYPKGKRHQNTPSITPAFRLEGLFAICPNTSSLDVRFTYLCTRATASVSGDFLYDTNGYPGFGSQDTPLYAGTARSKNIYKYYAGDLNYSRNLSAFCPDDFTFVIGLHIAYIKFNEHTTSSGSFSTDSGAKPLLNNLHRNSHFLGVGPQIGLDYQYNLCDPCSSFGAWALNARARGFLLCGNTKSKLTYVTLRTGPSGVGVKNANLWRVIPGASTDLGINYTFNCSCYTTNIEIGYEFAWYHNCVNKITGLDTAFAGDTIDVFNSFSFHGPYLRVSTSF